MALGMGVARTLNCQVSLGTIKIQVEEHSMR